VLIPRPETELLVVALMDLAKLRPAGAKLTIADVGTGSGILAVCAAKHLTNCLVMAVDISPAALETAKFNAKKHGVLERIKFVQSDLFASVADDRKFDFILSNPPYVAESEFEALAADVKKYEPRTALVAGPNGTEIIGRLITQSARRLESGGYLIMEISPMIHSRALDLLAAEPSFLPATTIKDLARLPRAVQAMKK
jgi:release factor glutamine methyltransferase